jgi:hypothetical protein
VNYRVGLLAAVTRPFAGLGPGTSLCDLGFCGRGIGDFALVEVSRADACLVLSVHQAGNEDAGKETARCGHGVSGGISICGGGNDDAVIVQV